MGIWLGVKEILIGLSIGLICLSPRFIDHISNFENIKKWNSYGRSMQEKHKALREAFEKKDLGGA